MAKELINLGWIEELLPYEYTRKKMFGGFAYYADDKLILVIFESEGNKSYQGKTYDFEIWNGCMFPVEKEKHREVLEDYPFLIEHPVLPKWLYLPYETEGFESDSQKILRELRRKNPLFGSWPNRKSSAKKDRKQKTEVIEKFVPRKPQMFSDEPMQKVMLTARKISDLKNLGPEMEKAFLKAGIKTPQQLVKLGWKKAMQKLCVASPKNNHSIVAYAVIGAIQGKIWNGISEEEKLEARNFMKQLRELDKKPTSKTNAKTKKKSSSRTKKLR